MEEVAGIAAFRSRQQVLRFESILKRAGLSARVISTPRDVAIGCGLSVEFSIRDTAAVQAILARARTSNLIGLYQIDRRAGGRPRLTRLSL
jgi:hypothetical protein